MDAMEARLSTKLDTLETQHTQILDKLDAQQTQLSKLETQQTQLFDKLDDMGLQLTAIANCSQTTRLHEGISIQ